MDSEFASSPARQGPGQPGLPASSHPSRRRDPNAVIFRAFARLDSMALGVAVGTVTGLTVFIATVVLLVKGGHPIGPRLQLLAQYFIGYSVTPKGSFIGLLYGFLSGFALGWVTASLRNALNATYLRLVHTNLILSSVQRFMDDL